tara:strand:+ start:1300 stop:1566 length:267 start_codon:yes stop_codon:yes gene_type:complete
VSIWFIIDKLLLVNDSGESFYENTSQCPVGDNVGLIFDSTNFYAESGGQIFDTGVAKGYAQRQSDVSVLSVLPTSFCSPLPQFYLFIF